MKHHTSRSYKPFLLFAAAFLTAAAACTRESADEAGGLSYEAAAPAPAPPMADATGIGAAALRSKVAGEVRTEMPTRQNLPNDTVSSSMIIRNGTASVEVDSLETAVAALHQLATSLGGIVGNVVMNTGEYTVRSATLELRIPSARFDDALAGLKPLGRVENSTTTAEDVGEEFVDVSARVANSRRLEERLVTLLATRTGKLEDVLAVERELARVREEIERYEGRLRYLRTRVATSTLSVTVHESAPLVNPNPGTSILGQAFKRMWRNFVEFVAMGIESLGFVVPLALIGWGLVVVWRRRRRRSAGEG